uniref:Uncharacterized protein n=1 Tax=Rhizophora mucronata TaxID=61149 RepID=A0A2P2PSW0_RHIMU
MIKGWNYIYIFLSTYPCVQLKLEYSGLQKNMNSHVLESL